MTIYEIKRRVLSANPDSHYFDRETLKFFGQTLRGFSVRRWGSPSCGVYRISAPIIIDRKKSGDSVMYFIEEGNLFLSESRYSDWFNLLESVK